MADDESGGTLRPVSGTPREVETALRGWLCAESEPEPLIIRTSGSTGNPKDVLLSRRAVSASAHATHARLGGPGQWLLDLPPQYVAGVQVLARSILAGERPVVATEHATLQDAIAAMDGRRRYASLVPTQLHRLAEAGQLDVLGSLDAVLVGGAALDPGLRARADEAGVRVVRTYGMSETAGGCVYDGVPLDGVALRIDVDSRVWLAGPVLFDGYDGDSSATAEVLHDGWLRTSDLGELDADGRLRVLGRTDDVVISGGVNIALPRVSEALRRVDGVADAVAVGVPDAEWGRRVVAVVVGDVPLEALRDGVQAAGLPRSWAPRRAVSVDALPLLGHGKVDRQAVQALAADA
ncbi:AMP-binding protein [Mumia zhuanghuii]|uniref:AMP-binding protein n=1 Tax=Mumia zhuanghuii TaxID=2585211 RepID=A0A5C4ME62_9ACTN|nr:AMP-binding protein [Mumia zhuanghuii]TNC40983.1 AMP-binding protein [Mumia zhuanghuii]TNC49273.1 AMP-binding protein [Mumia zhuanghuii]